MNSAKEPIVEDIPKKYRKQSFRDNLKVYIESPESYKNVIYYDDDVVLVRDMFPKSKMHLLLMTRDPHLTHVHPLEIMMKHRSLVEKLVSYVQGDLSGLIFDEARNCLSQQLTNEALCNYIKVGFHAGPSMNNLHLHIMTLDHVSPSLKNSAHYISFTSPFFVKIDTPTSNLPTRGTLTSLFQEDLKCWRCGETFGRHFTKLKAHLQEEYDDWLDKSVSM